MSLSASGGMKMGANMFDDLLGTTKLGSTKNEPKTIKEMRNETLALETDPYKLAVSMKQYICIYACVCIFIQNKLC